MDTEEIINKVIKALEKLKIQDAYLIENNCSERVSFP